MVFTFLLHLDLFNLLWSWLFRDLQFGGVFLLETYLLLASIYDAILTRRCSTELSLLLFIGLPRRHCGLLTSLLFLTSPIMDP